MSNTKTLPQSFDAHTANLIAERKQFLRNNPDYREIASGPDLKGMVDSLSIGDNIRQPNTNPMVCMKLAKPFNGLEAIHLAITLMERIDQMDTTSWDFKGIMTYDESDSIGQHRGVEGSYSTWSKTGHIRFFERKDSK